MTRKKVKLVRITNEAARKASLKKRRVGLCKKVNELSILCDVNAFVIIYSPDETEPVTWPTRPEVEEMLEKYESIPETERMKKMINQEIYLKERISKAEDNLKKDSKKNNELEMSYLMHKLRLGGNDINCLELNEKQSLIWLLEEKMRDLKKRIHYFQQVPPFVPPGQEQQVLPPPSSPRPFLGEFRANPTDSMMWDQWFREMVKNDDHTAGGSGSSAPRAPPISQGFHFGDFGGNNVGGLGLAYGLSSGEGNPFEMAMASLNPNPFGFGFSQEDLGGSSSTPLGFGPIPPHTTNVGGIGDDTGEGLSKILHSGSDVAGLPWPPNIS